MSRTRLPANFVWAILLLTTHFGPSTYAAEPVSITFVDWWGPPRSDGYQEIIDAFEAQFPEIDVTYAPGDSSAEKALTLIAAGNPPDVLAVSQNFMSGLLARGIAQPLDDFMARDRIDRSLFLPGALEGITYQGKVYGLPKVYNPTHMFANAGALAEAGLAVPELGWTTAEFEDYLQKLTITNPDGTPERYGMKPPQITNNGWLFLHGGRYLDPDTGMATITAEPFVKAARWLGELKRRGFIGDFPGGTDDNFANGQIVFADHAWLTRVVPIMSKEPRFPVHTVYLPQGDGPPVTFLTIHPHVITSMSEHPREAWEFLKFFNLSEEANRIRAEYSLAPGSVLGLRLTRELVSLPSNQDRDAIFATYMQPTSSIVGMPRTVPGFAEAANEYIWPTVERIVNGEADARTALEEVVDNVNQVLAEAAEAGK